MRDRSLLTPLRCANSPGLCMHVVDTTLFYSPTSGGVKRYLTAKHEWLRANTSCQHTIVVPGESDHFDPGEIRTLSPAAESAARAALVERAAAEPHRSRRRLPASLGCVAGGTTARHPRSCVLS